MAGILFLSSLPIPVKSWFAERNHSFTSVVRQKLRVTFAKDTQPEDVTVERAIEDGVTVWQARAMVEGFGNRAKSSADSRQRGKIVIYSESNQASSRLPCDQKRR